MEQQEAQLQQQQRHGEDSSFNRRSFINVTGAPASASLRAAGPAKAPPPRGVSVPSYAETAQSSPSSSREIASSSSVASCVMGRVLGTRSKAAARGLRVPARRTMAAAPSEGTMSSAALSSGGGPNAFESSLSSHRSPVVDQHLLFLAREMVDVDVVRRRRALKKIENFLRPLPVSSVAVLPSLYLPASSPCSYPSFPLIALPVHSAAVSPHAAARAALAVSGAAAGSSPATSPAYCPKGRRLTLSLQQFERMWLMLFYAAWLSDKPLVQRELFVRLALLQRLLHAPEEKRRFFKAFFLVLQRQWGALDQHRLDKFLLLVRIITAELSAMIIAACRYCSSSGGRLVFSVCGGSDMNVSSSLSNNSQSTSSIRSNSSSSSNANDGRGQQMKNTRIRKKKQAGCQQASVAVMSEGEQPHATVDSHSVEKHLRKTFLIPMAKFLATELLMGSQGQRGAGQGLRMQFIDCFLSEYRASAASSSTGVALSAASSSPASPIACVCAAIGSGSVTPEPKKAPVVAQMMSSQQRAAVAATAEPQQQKPLVASNQQQQLSQRSISSSSSFAADGPILRFVLFPFLYAACYCDDPIVLRAVHERVLRKLEPRDLDFRPLLATLFSLASAGGICNKNMRLLYATLDELERKFIQQQKQRRQEPQRNAASAISRGEELLLGAPPKELLLTEASSDPAVKRVVGAILSLHIISSSSSNRSKKRSCRSTESKKRSAEGSNSGSSITTGDGDAQACSSGEEEGAPAALGSSGGEIRPRKRRVRTWEQQANEESTDAAAGSPPDASEAGTHGMWPTGDVTKAKEEERKNNLLPKNNLFRFIRESASGGGVSSKKLQQQQQQQRQQQLPWNQQKQRKGGLSMYGRLKKQLPSGNAEQPDLSAAAVDNKTIRSPASSPSSVKIISCVGSVKQQRTGSASARRRCVAFRAAAASTCDTAASPAPAAAAAEAQVAAAAAAAAGPAVKRRLETTTNNVQAEVTNNAVQENVTAADPIRSQGLKQEHVQTLDLHNAEEQLQQCGQQGKQQQGKQQEVLQQQVLQQPQQQRQQAQKQGQQERRRQQQRQQDPQRQQDGEQEKGVEISRGPTKGDQCNTRVSEVSRLKPASAGITPPRQQPTKCEDVIPPVERKTLSCTSVADGSSASTVAATSDEDKGRKREQTPVMSATSLRPTGSTDSSSSSASESDTSSSSYSRLSTGVSTSSSKAKKNAAGNSSRRVCFDLKKNRVAAFHWLQPPCAVGPAVSSSVESLPVSTNRKCMAAASPREVSADGATAKAGLTRSSENSCVPGCSVKFTKNGTAAAGEGSSTKGRMATGGGAAAAAAADAIGCNGLYGSYDAPPASSPLAASSSLHPCAPRDTVVGANAAAAVSGSNDSEAARLSVNGGISAPATCSDLINKSDEEGAGRARVVAPAPRVLKSILKKRQQKCFPAAPPDSISNTGSSEYVWGSKPEPTDRPKIAVKRLNLNNKRFRFRSSKSGPVLALPDGSLHDSSTPAVPATAVVTKEVAATPRGAATTAKTEEDNE